MARRTALEVLQPAVHTVQQAGAYVGRRRRAADRRARQVGQLRVVESVGVPRQLVLARRAASRTAAGRPRPARSAPRPRTAGVRAPPPATRRRRGRRSRRGRPPGSRPARRATPSAPDRRPRVRRARSGRRPGRPGRRARWPGPAARRRAASTAGRPAWRCGTPRRSPTRGRAARRWTGRSPTTPWSVYCPASRASVFASRGWRVRFAAMITPMPTPVASDGLARRVHDQLREGGQAAEPRAVAARVDLDLQPARTLRGLVLGRLPHQPAYVLGLAQHRTGDVVEPLEAEPAAFVSRLQAGWPLVDEGVGQVHLVLAGQLDERGVAHRTGEVHMQMSLGQRGNRTGLHAQILPYAGGPPCELPQESRSGPRRDFLKKLGTTVQPAVGLTRI